MVGPAGRRRRVGWGAGLRLALLGLLLLPAACGGEDKAAPGSSANLATAAPPAASAPPAPQKLLKVEPVQGAVGDTFTITGQGLPPNKDVQFVWATAEGSYVTKAGAENVEFHEKRFEDKQVPLGRAVADADGRVAISLTAPEDYGEVHDIFAVVDGQSIARGGYRLMRTVAISPREGPLGTPITVTVTGLGWRTYESTIAVRYDNNFTGIVSAVTTRGTAKVQIRAAGLPGSHVIDINHGAKSSPYLNNQQSGTAHIPDWRFTFTVTEADAAPPLALDWPDAAPATALDGAAPRTTAAEGLTATGVTAALSPASGPILSEPSLRASGLAAGGEVELFWVTARGNRVSPSGWSLNETPLVKAVADRSGTITTRIQVPDDLGGWHMVKLVQGDKVVAEAPYFVERSLVDVTPMRVKAGETFTVHIKGVGWTELDNGVAVTYDNAHIGFACGFNSNGDVTMELVATGGPGVHLIDLYPMIYQGHGKPPWGYQVPLLSFKQDAPGLALGYRLPVFRLAITVVE